MKHLNELPNIGKALERKLRLAGINSAEDLINTGSEKALLRIRASDPSACFNMLCALEGAIQGIRWHQLPPQKKEELKMFLLAKGIL